MATDTADDVPATRFERRAPAVPMQVTRLRAELDAWTGELGLDRNHRDAVRLAVSEALTNAVMHAFTGREPGTLHLVAEQGEGVLVVRVGDDGIGMGPRHDSPGMGMGVPIIGKLCQTVDLTPGPGGQGTVVRMVFAVPGLHAASPPAGHAAADILATLTRMGSGDAFEPGDIVALADLLVPGLADLCSVSLADGSGTGRRVGARVARPDGTLDEAASAWVMSFPLTEPDSPSLTAAQTGRTSVAVVDEAFAHAVSPDALRAQELLDLGLAWWAAVPLVSGGRTVGAISVAGRAGTPDAAVATVEQVTAHAGGLVATASLLESLRRTQGRLERILAALAEAVTVSDDDGRIIFANPAAVGLLEARDAEELIRAAPGEISAHFTITDEHGEPVDVTALPPRRVVAGQDAPPLLTRSVSRASGLTRWLRTTSTRLEDGPLVVNVMQDVTAVKAAEIRQTLLARASEIVAGGSSAPDATARIAALTVPAIADGCLLDLAGDDGTLVPAAVSHIDPERLRLLERLRRAPGPETEAGDDDGSLLPHLAAPVVNDLTDELLRLGARDEAQLAALRELGVRAVATVPLTADGRAIGRLTLVDDVSRRVFSPDDLAAAHEIAQRVAAAVENARLQAEAARSQQELRDSLARMRLLADAGFGGLISGVGNRIVEANSTFLAMLGYERVEDLPPWPQMTPPEWATVDAAAVRQMRDAGTSPIFEKEYLRRDGTRARVILGFAVTDPERFEWIGLVVDMSGRRSPDVRAAAGIDRLTLETGAPSGTEVADVVSGLEAAILIQRPGKGIVYANQAAAEAMGMAAPQDVVAATPEEIARGWDTFDEHGVPLVAARYPSRRILLGERDVEPLVVRTINRETGREYWRQIRARPVLDKAGELTMIVSMTEDITAMRRAMLTQHLLAEAGRVLSSSLDYVGTLQALADLMVPDFADWCSVSLPDEHGGIGAVAIAHTDPAKVRFAWDYDRRYPSTVHDEDGGAAILRGGPAVLIPDIPDELLEERVADPEQRELLRGIGMRSVLQVPIAPPHGSPIGVLTLVNAESGRVFRDSDLVLAEELGRRAGTAVQNARLHAERARIAATLQASLLPAELPEVDGWELASSYRAAGAENWVGGDFLDVFACPGGWMLLVGDVAGHGASAAALTAQARHTLRAIGEATGDPVAALGHLNRQLLPRVEPALVTACLAAIREAPDGRVTAVVACAGHPPPYRVRDGVPESIGRPGPLLGAWEEAVFTATDVEVRPGDLLVIYTDGVLDARRDDERFGERRLVETLAGPPGAAEAVRAVQHRLDAFQTGRQADDTAILAARRRPAG
ncbi:SpoIIE family protein phosphatase [Paraconexibacter antarcticus]|uniref:SpoIIE family protein phosphatase n=1 Tax=Paraconexibacter antarcticus TaxID=2949664 RepID=A0ABY5DVL3_9ACTN|nr:SpoIIE family protein phosphatase [Paraconexibacter antarcticus]UTI66035.1 SpoIIE family protein phosphatase [Paraconexibacter antarcticus]